MLEKCFAINMSEYQFVSIALSVQCFTISAALSLSDSISEMPVDKHLDGLSVLSEPGLRTGPRPRLVLGQ